MEPRTIFFIGKPGSGKGTQAKLLSEHTGWPVMGTSGGLRELVKEGGVVGEKIKKEMDEGFLSPYFMASFVYLKSIFSVPENQSVIFDGANRTLPEAQVVLDSLKWLGRPFSIVHLTTTDDEIRARIALRKEQEGRVDDHEHAVTKRLSEYYDLTDKVVEFYRKEGLLIDVHGEGPREEIAATIAKVLAIP
jgi:adenylate kinase